MTNVCLTPVEMDDGDEPVLISPDIEYNKIADFVRIWEGGTQSLKAEEVVLLHDFEPPGKGIFTIGVLL